MSDFCFLCEQYFAFASMSASTTDATSILGVLLTSFEHNIEPAHTFQTSPQTSKLAWWDMRNGWFFIFSVSGIASVGMGTSTTHATSVLGVLLTSIEYDIEPAHMFRTSPHTSKSTRWDMRNEWFSFVLVSVFCSALICHHTTTKHAILTSS